MEEEEDLLLICLDHTELETLLARESGWEVALLPWPFSWAHPSPFLTAAFFQDCISEQDLDEMNIEIIRNTLYKVSTQRD